MTATAAERRNALASESSSPLAVALGMGTSSSASEGDMAAFELESDGVDGGEECWQDWADVVAAFGGTRRVRCYTVSVQWVRRVVTTRTTRTKQQLKR